MIKLYKLMKDYPGHNIGDFVCLNEKSYYTFNNEPKYKLDQKQVENYPDFFEEVVLDWDRGDQLFFISVIGEIIEEEFNPHRHSLLVEKRNAFKTYELAEEFLNQIKSVLSDDFILINVDEIKEIFSDLNNDDIEKVKKKLNKFL